MAGYKSIFPIHRRGDDDLFAAAWFVVIARITTNVNYDQYQNNNISCC
jgi:hypothetical protein